MNKPMTLPRLVCLTTALAAGSASMTADIANARQNHQHATGHIQQRQAHPANYAKRYGFSPRFAISGQPANVNGVLNQRKAGNTAPAAKLPNGTVYATDKRVMKALSAAATVSIVPAAAAVGTAIIGHPGLPIIGTIQHGNPITGPVQEGVDFAKEYTSDVAKVIDRLW
jgi:hypothetical protein